MIRIAQRSVMACANVLATICAAARSILEHYVVRRRKRGQFSRECVGPVHLNSDSIANARAGINVPTRSSTKLDSANKRLSLERSTKECAEDAQPHHVAASNATFVKELAQIWRTLEWAEDSVSNVSTIAWRHACAPAEALAQAYTIILWRQPVVLRMVRVQVALCREKSVMHVRCGDSLKRVRVVQRVRQLWMEVRRTQTQKHLGLRMGWEYGRKL